MSLIRETDYRTPTSKSEKNVTLTIDGQPVTVPDGTSIMRAAMQLGIQIPKLCATDSLTAFGSCRLCLIEIDGRNGTPASCTTPVAPGISVRTYTTRLDGIRRGVMELYLSDHPLDCLTCAANGDCELQDMAGAISLRRVRYDNGGANHVFARNNGKPMPNGSRRMNPIPILLTIPPSALSAIAACARARRRKERSR
jgi:formate dehydrogenase major subunit